jgi:hypothetical protein
MAVLINVTKTLNSMCKIFSSMSVTSMKTKCVPRYGHFTYSILQVRLCLKMRKIMVPLFFSAGS